MQTFTNSQLVSSLILIHAAMPSQKMNPIMLSATSINAWPLLQNFNFKVSCA
jgi:hypothetical protein